MRLALRGERVASLFYLRLPDNDRRVGCTAQIISSVAARAAIMTSGAPP